jgi:hypothetical protein
MRGLQTLRFLYATHDLGAFWAVPGCMSATWCQEQGPREESWARVVEAKKSLGDQEATSMLSTWRVWLSASNVPTIFTFLS